MAWIETKDWYRQKSEEDQYWLRTLILDIHQRNWREFEELTQLLMSELGFEAVLTKASHDDGIDVEVRFGREPFDEKAIIQCKKWSNNVDYHIVNALIADCNRHSAKMGLLITTSSFTPRAREDAQNSDLKITLWDGYDFATHWIEGLLKKRINEYGESEGVSKFLNELENQFPDLDWTDFNARTIGNLGTLVNSDLLSKAWGKLNYENFKFSMINNSAPFLTCDCNIQEHIFNFDSSFIDGPLWNLGDAFNFILHGTTGLIEINFDDEESWNQLVNFERKLNGFVGIWMESWDIVDFEQNERFLGSGAKSLIDALKQFISKVNANWTRGELVWVIATNNANVYVLHGAFRPSVHGNVLITVEVLVPYILYNHRVLGNLGGSSPVFDMKLQEYVLKQVETNQIGAVDSNESVCPRGTIAGIENLPGLYQNRQVLFETERSFFPNISIAGSNIGLGVIDEHRNSELTWNELNRVNLLFSPKTISLTFNYLVRPITLYSCVIR